MLPRSLPTLTRTCAPLTREVEVVNEHGERERIFAPYQVNDALMDAAAPDVIALHPLPAHDGLEITRSVYHGPRSAIWDEAENRLYVQAALLTHLLGEA